MAEKDKNERFVVSDRRKFTSEGELRSDTETSDAQDATPSPEAPPPSPAPPFGVAAQASTPDDDSTKLQNSVTDEVEAIAAPTPKEQRDQEDAYKRSTTAMDSSFHEELSAPADLEQGENAPHSFEMTFERLIASLYMTAMLQLGMARPEGGEPQPDITGARQTIDTLALLNDKTKGNLTKTEGNLLQNCLFELRMAYIEITNRIVQPPPGGGLQSAK